ncbi:unnamed protein product, partial [Bubo scandiacus]
EFIARRARILFWDNVFFGDADGTAVTPCPERLADSWRGDPALWTPARSDLLIGDPVSALPEQSGVLSLNFPGGKEGLCAATGGRSPLSPRAEGESRLSPPFQGQSEAARPAAASCPLPEGVLRTRCLALIPVLVARVTAGGGSVGRAGGAPGAGSDAAGSGPSLSGAVLEEEP